MSLHGEKGLGKKDRKGWHCDKILVHLAFIIYHENLWINLKLIRWKRKRKNTNKTL